MNKKVIKGLETIAMGLLSVVEGLKEADENNSVEIIAESTNATQDNNNTRLSVYEDTKKEFVTEKDDNSESVADVTNEEETSDDSVSGYTEEQLKGMSYNDLKKLAKELGITAVGNRKELVKKILSVNATAVTTVNKEDEEEVESVVEHTEEKPAKRPTPKSFKKTKVEEPEPEPEPDEDEEDEDIDPIEAKVKEATDDMSDSEIRELLNDIGVSSKGKRQALISKLVDAVNEGLLDLGDDEDDSPDEVKSADITEGMTKERKKAYEELCDETSEAFENGEITREDLIEFINSFNGTNDKFKGKSDESLIVEYMELSALLIDDEGNIVEEGAYTINDEPYCCGHPLKYDEDDEKFICECCGSEYEAE